MSSSTQQQRIVFVKCCHGKYQEAHCLVTFIGECSGRQSLPGALNFQTPGRQVCVHLTAYGFTVQETPHCLTYSGNGGDLQCLDFLVPVTCQPCQQKLSETKHLRSAKLFIYNPRSRYDSIHKFMVRLSWVSNLFSSLIHSFSKATCPRQSCRKWPWSSSSASFHATEPLLLFFRRMDAGSRIPVSYNFRAMSCPVPTKHHSSFTL